MNLNIPKPSAMIILCSKKGETQETRNHENNHWKAPGARGPGQYHRSFWRPEALIRLEISFGVSNTPPWDEHPEPLSLGMTNKKWEPLWSDENPTPLPHSLNFCPSPPPFRRPTPEPLTIIPRRPWDKHPEPPTPAVRYTPFPS